MYNNQKPQRHSNYGGGNNYNQSQESELITKIKEQGTFSNLFKDKAKEYTTENGLASKFALSLKTDPKSDIKTSQLRKFYAKIKEIDRNVPKTGDFEDKKMNELYNLLPDIAYASGRKSQGKDLIPKEFYNFFKYSIDDKKIKTNEDFKIFVDIFSAIIAYAKFHGAKE